MTKRLLIAIGVTVASAAVLLPAANATPNPTSVTVAGSLQSELGCAGDWDPACATTHLTYDAGDDVWQGTFTVPADVPPGTPYEYKAALNDAWDENYGLHAVAGGANIPLDLPAARNVKFYYDHKTHWITDNVNSVIAVAPGSFQSALGCPGDWDPGCLRSWLEDPDGDGIYTFETTALPAGNYEAKVAINEAWDENYGLGGVPGGANIPFTVGTDHAKVTFSYDSVTHVLTITVNEPKPVTTISLDPASPDVNGWYVFAVKATVSASDPAGSGIAETRCALDPATPPGSFTDLPAAPCPYAGAGAYVMAEGVHTLWAGSKNLAGGTDLVSRTFGIDKTGPVATVTPLAAFETAAGFPVSWSAVDNLSGVSSYDVRYRQAPSNGTFGSYTTWLSHTTSTGGTFTAPAGSTTCFSARASDKAGWTAAWSAEQCTTVPLDDPALARIGFWSTVTGPGYYGPGISRSTWIGNQLSATMRGQAIGVLVTRQPGGGQIQLRWNGYTQATVSLSAASVQKQQLVTFTLPSVQTGTLSIVQTGYGTVDIDGAGASKTS
jgi:hypothetical protein